ncbi:paramyosin-like [Paramacrobiotus metropolitanus]|uniref:paramyosin-like n=1 Tax=Paramacrobiotus metropolitanus TaxID=2943436 RepID=UPI002445E01A|nr:paramyosin-like [Paramacrobiotus metropolitanus]
MVSGESNESYFTDDETTMNTSFHTAMKEADRAEGMTLFKDIPEHLIERTQYGKIINVRSPSPNSPTSTLKSRLKELENELAAKESQVRKLKQEHRDKQTSMEARLYELEQQQGDLESAADEWKIKFERQKELAEEYLRMVDDRTMEGHLAVSDLSESMSEESAERSRHLAELKEECDQLRQKVTEAEAKRDEYAPNFPEVTQRLSKLAAETFKLRNELNSRDEAISILQNESKGHQKRADEAENKREEATKVARDLRDLVATEGERLKNEIKKVTEENKKVTEDCQKATKEGLKWQNEARRLDTMVTVLEVKEKEWQQQIAQQKQENVKVTNELYEMTRTVMSKDDEVTEVRTQLKLAAEGYQKLEGEVAQLAEHIKKMESNTEKIVQEKTFQLHQHKLKVKEENQKLKIQKEESELKIKRLEDENKALNMSNKHKDEQLLQYGAKTATVESPPPSYSKAQETCKSYHFEMPLRTGTGKGGAVKTEPNDEKVTEDDQISDGLPTFDETSRFTRTVETKVIVDEERGDEQPRQRERQRRSAKTRVRRNQDSDSDSTEEDSQETAKELTKALNSMARKTNLATFDGSRDAVTGWTRLVRDTQKTYQLTDDQIMIEIASAVKEPAKIWFEGEREIALEEEEEYSVTEWLNKFKDEYGDRDEEVLGLQVRTPTDIKDFFRTWSAGEDRYKVPKGQRTQEYATIAQGKWNRYHSNDTQLHQFSSQWNIAWKPQISRGMAITETEMAVARITAATAVVASAAGASEEEAEALAAEIGMVATAAAVVVAAKETTNRVVAPKIWRRTER